MLLKRATLFLLLGITTTSMGGFKTFAEALNTEDSQGFIAEQKPIVSSKSDTVYLNPEGEVRHVLEVERNTRGLKENVKYYSTLVVIGLVAIGAIGFLIFRKGKTE
ncbi:MAG: hypothetical protein KDC92_02455 [Bacteroidetes bacterium]|nr:hypothetical protein [Bacteroidota bacterium]